MRARMSTRATHRAVTLWLTTACVLIATMVVVGGVTRLTGSGLSIVEWAPVRGTLPPLTHEAWQHQLALYSQSPEGRLAQLDLPAFQRIFLVEWGHRLLGRLVGLTIVVPLALFLVSRSLPRRTARRGIAAAVLVGAQGAMGWLMVSSGLVDVPHVSTVRLAMHLLLAFTLFGLLAWELWDHLAWPQVESNLALPSRAFLALAVIAVTSGAAMAGTRGGWLFATFPKMNGAWLPEGSFAAGASALVNDPVTAHFAHRLMALLLALATIALAWAARNEAPVVRRRVAWIAAAVTVQITLGAATVMLHMPIAIAVTHQLGGLGVFATAVALVRAARTQRVTSADYFSSLQMTSEPPPPVSKTPQT